MSHVICMCPNDAARHELSARVCEVCGGVLRFYCAVHREWLFGPVCSRCDGIEATATTARTASVLKQAETVLGCSLRTEGELGLLNAPRRALLVSRTKRNPAPTEGWVRGVIDAATHAILASETLVVGDGRVPWQLALWTCRQHGGSAIVVGAANCAPGEFRPKNALLVWPEKQSPPIKKEARMVLRDRLVGLLATNAYSIQLRRGGNMECVGAEMKARGADVIEWPCNDKVVREPPAPDAWTIRGDLPPISFAGRLTHFTREPDGPWPGETDSDYFNWLWLSNSRHVVRRDAFQTLRRILSETKLRGCGRLIRNRTPMVCFTQREPSELLAENRWRKGLLRRAYSPYAISFLQADLSAFDARPVQYMPRECFKPYSADDMAFFQIESSAGVDWVSELEWRVRGDVDFSHIDPRRIAVLVAHDFEAAQLEREFGVQARTIKGA